MSESTMKTYLESRAYDSDSIVMVCNEKVQTWDDVYEPIKTAITDYANAHAYIPRSNQFYVGIEVLTADMEHHFNTIVPYEVVVSLFGQRDATGQRVFEEEVIIPTAKKLLVGLLKWVSDPKGINKVVAFATEIVDITKKDVEDK